MTPWLRELRHAARKLARAPGFSAVSVLTLALGIGATTAIFTVVNAVLLRPLPYREPERLVGLWHGAPGVGMAQIEQARGTYLLYRNEARSFDGVGLYDDGAVNVTNPGGNVEPERVSSASVTATLLPVLGVRPVIGRWISEAEDRPGGPPVALIGEALWRRKFGGDRAVLGRTIAVDGMAREIVGVMPARFAFPTAETQLWLPLGIDEARADAFSFDFYAVARLRPGVTVEDARRDVQRLIPLIPERFPSPLVTKQMFDQLGLTAIVRPLRDDVVGDVARVLWVVLGTAAVVLLIASANVANLFLVRAEGRQKEVAVRSALGAGRRDLLRLVLAEGLLLAAGGGLLGLALAWAGTGALVRLAPFSLPRLAEISVDGRVLAVAALVTLLAGLLFSILPLARYRAMSLASALKEGGRGSTSGRERHRARSALVVSQVALALVLLAGAGLMARSFWALRSVDPGFDASRVLTLRLALPETSYPREEQRARFYAELVRRVGELPGVRAAGAVSKLPLLGDGHNTSIAWIESVPTAPGALPPVHEIARATDGWFRTMAIPLREGRDFTPLERERPTDAVIVSEALARRYWKRESALGKRLRPRPSSPWYTIVGVVGSVRGAGLERPPEEMIYYPMVPAAGDTGIGVRHTMSLAVRSDGDPRALVAAVRREIAALDPALPMFNLRTMAEVVRGSTARTSFTLLLLGIASAVALLLGAVGIYGVISYTVSLRTREIGVRMALGARAPDVGWMVTRQGVTLALVGVALGLGGAYLLTRSLRTLLFEVAPGDPLTLVAAAAALTAISALASAVPALRAARVDPVEALRGAE